MHTTSLPKRYTVAATVQLNKLYVLSKANLSYGLYLFNNIGAILVNRTLTDIVECCSCVYCWVDISCNRFILFSIFANWFGKTVSDTKLNYSDNTTDTWSAINNIGLRFFFRSLFIKRTVFMGPCHFLLFVCITFLYLCYLFQPNRLHRTVNFLSLFISW